MDWVSPFCCLPPLTPVLEQSFAVITAVWSSASESALRWEVGSFGMGCHVYKPLFFFNLNSCSSSGRKQHLHTHNSLPRLAPAFLLTTQGTHRKAHLLTKKRSLMLHVPVRYQTQKYWIRNRRHKHRFFSFLLSYIMHCLLLYSPSAASNKHLI